MSKLPYTPNWSRMSTSTGYPVVHCPSHPRAWSTGYVLAHRVVMEQSLGRLLETWEIVHHIDHNKSNYDISNLELTTQTKHSKGHARPSTILEMVCPNCNQKFRRRRDITKLRTSKRTFCSRFCNGTFYHGNRFDIFSPLSSVGRARVL